MAVVNGYITIDEATAYIGRNETSDPTELDEVITSASRLIDGYCGRHFYQVAATRYFDSRNLTEVELGPFNDLVSLSSFTFDYSGSGVYGTEVSASGYQLQPVGAASGAPVAQPFTKIRVLQGLQLPQLPTPSGREGLIKLVAVWGWPEVPVDVKQATKILVAEVAKLADAPLGVAGFGEFGVVRVQKQMSARAQQLLQPYRHPGNIGIA